MQENDNILKSSFHAENIHHLSRFWRFVVYGLAGFCAEISFTAVWELVENGNRKLHGLTSVWSFPQYALCILMIEKLYLHFLKDSVPLLGRAFIYLLWIYAWEFSTGLLLRQFNACPWDYEPYFQGHFMGLITLEYAPLWFVTCLLCEQVLIRLVLQLRWSNDHRQHELQPHHTTVATAAKYH